jgi:protein TonB
MAGLRAAARVKILGSLKTFLSVSLGVHLLVVSAVSLGLKHPSLERIEPTTIEVYLVLPAPEETMTEEKPPQEQFIPPRRTEVKNEVKNIEVKEVKKEQRLEMHPPQKELVKQSPFLQPLAKDVPKLEGHLRPDPKEQPLEKLDRETEPPPAVTERISEESPLPLSEELEKEEIQEEPAKMEMAAVMPLPDLDKNEPIAPSPKAASFHQDLAVVLPTNRIRKLEEGPPPPPQEGPPQIAKAAPPSEEVGILIQPKYLRTPKPSYPHEARRRGYQGEVMLRVEVLPSGHVGQIELKKSSGHEILDRSALTTIKEWTFVPARKGEKSVPLWVNIPIKFKLE